MIETQINFSSYDPEDPNEFPPPSPEHEQENSRDDKNEAFCNVVALEGEA